ERVLLAQRLQGEPAKTARYLNDVLRLQPPNMDRVLSLFDTAVKSGSLDTGDAFGFAKAKSEAPENRRQALPAKEPAMPSPPLGAPGRAGGMGAGSLGGLSKMQRGVNSAERKADEKDAKQRDGRSVDRLRKL